MKNVAALKALLSVPKHIVITVHQRPDPDTLGTGLALAGLLKKQKHHVHVISPDAYATSLAWMAGAAEVIIDAQEQREAVSGLLKNADLIFCIDFPAPSRLGELGPLVENATATKVVIDHHPTTEVFGDLVFRDTQAAATAELLYKIIEEIDAQNLVDADVAECLYAGIMTDTGSFQHASTKAQTHLTVARLMAHGADTARVSRCIYGNNSLHKLKFLGFALSHRLVVYEQYNTAYFVVKAADYEQYQLQTGDTEELVSYALSVQGIVLAALIKETKDAIRLSLRSVGDVPVNVWAREYFGGGGHKNAAGGISQLTLEETIAQLENLIKSKQKILNPHL
ncbi:MAG: DHH family phosphoesterase [Roseivirga sp.]